MKYGQGFWVVKNGVRVRDVRDAYPDGLKPFLYSDGDLGWFHLGPFCFDYVKPGDRSGTAWRFEIAGDPAPVLHRNSFDYDGASIPPALRALARDKMDRRWIVPSDGHDLGYCIHGHVTGFTKADWDTFLLETGEAYGDNAYQCAKYRLAVAIGGGLAWQKPEAELEIYRRLVKIKRVPL